MEQINLTKEEIKELKNFLDYHLTDNPCEYDLDVGIIGDILHKLGWKSALENLKETINKTEECLKCGEECGTKLVGDEFVLYCRNCNYYDGQ